MQRHWHPKNTKRLNHYFLGAQVVVGTGSMQMVFSPADIAPADGSTIQGGQRGQQSSGAGSTAARKEARQRLSDERMRRRYPEEGEGAAPVAVEDARIQTEANTVDLRGQTVDDVNPLPPSLPILTHTYM